MAWRAQAPWPDDSQVEQDLALSRALVEIFSATGIASELTLRGGTALHKLFLGPVARYSEDIDLVQRNAGPIGPVTDGIRDCLDLWLGKPKWKAGPNLFTLTYRFESESPPVRPLRLKVEINTREHFSVYDAEEKEYSVTNAWFTGSAGLRVFALEEMLATKLRALYQRKKGRDLFDLDLALAGGTVDPLRIAPCFSEYMDRGGTPVSRAQFEANLSEKETDEAFRNDVLPLLRPGVEYDVDAALGRVKTELIALLPGAPFKGTTGG
jgi:predicted nucleotidyltransferase component of viral defense system